MPLEMVHVDGGAPRVRRLRASAAPVSNTDETGTRRAGDTVDVTATDAASASRTSGTRRRT